MHAELILALFSSLRAAVVRAAPPLPRTPVRVPGQA
jgi:hypothetical protein